jgi:hypothetical protein
MDIGAADPARESFVRRSRPDHGHLERTAVGGSVRDGLFFGAAWTDEAKRVVAQFRATHDLWAGDPAFLDLLDRLRRGSPEFRR